MRDKQNYFLEDLLAQTESILTALEDVDVLFESENEINERISAETREHFLKDEYEGREYRTDGSIDVKIREDCMQVIADFYPPTEGMKPLTYEDVAEILAEKKISFGVGDEVIKNSLFKCNTDFKVVGNVIIAEGRPPVNHVPMHYVVDEQLLDSGRDEPSKQSRIDYKEISPFKLVKEGQYLARNVPEQPGEYGKTVFGEEIQFSTIRRGALMPGNNTISLDDHVVSACDGIFELDDLGFHVNEVLQIQSDVDYSTGNIEFPGDVVIRGQIRDGFTIKSGGSVYTLGTLDTTVIDCENDLYVGLGIIGRKKGRIRAGGKIKAKFIENCFVESGDIIMLEAGLMNSEIYTCDRITMGKKGVIVGGCIYAQNGIIATQIGTAMGPRTEIYCGVDYVVENKLKWIRDNSMQVAVKLNQVRDQISKSSAPDTKLIEFRDKLHAALRKLNNTASNLVYKLDKNDNAEVVARGSVYPGVYIEICHVSYVVSREMGPVRFKLDKSNGVIKVDSIR